MSTLPTLHMILPFALLMSLAGCIPSGTISSKTTMRATDIAPLYTPTTEYDRYSCAQLGIENQNINNIIADMSGKLERGDYDQSGSVALLP